MTKSSLGLGRALPPLGSAVRVKSRLRRYSVNCLSGLEAGFTGLAVAARAVVARARLVFLGIRISSVFARTISSRTNSPAAVVGSSPRPSRHVPSLGSVSRAFGSSPPANLGLGCGARCACSHFSGQPPSNFSSEKRPRVASSGFQRSPRSRTRSGTFTMVKSVMSNPASTSSHVTGVDTVAWTVGRTE
jgi:hypothetical protein